MDATQRADGERKLVSAVFADFEGFTRMVAEGDPELVRERLGGAYSRLIPAVIGLGGTVEKVVGDGIMALFGAPASHGDDAVRACRAAEALRLELARYNRELGLTLALHIGVGTGIVVAGEFGPLGHRGYAATGDAVNRAARLAAAAPGGHVYCDEATAAAAGGAFAFEPLAPLALKGFRDEQRAFKLLGEKPAGPASRRPFVGRKAELAALRGLAKAGGESVAYICGEAGIGKSRLAEEFLGAYAAAEASAPAYGRERPYALWRELASEAGMGVKAEGPAERRDDEEAYDDAELDAEGAASAWALELLASLHRDGRRIIALDGLEAADGASMELAAAVAASGRAAPRRRAQARTSPLEGGGAAGSGVREYGEFRRRGIRALSGCR